MSAAAVRKPPGVEARPHVVPRVAFSLASATFLLAGVLSAAINIAAPFEHGWWLVAYLSLVGALSQLLLGVGQSLLAENAASRVPADSLVLIQLALWGLGTIAVAAGDLTGARAVLLCGSGLLLVDLALFAGGLRRVVHGAARPAAAQQRGYAALLVFLAISVLVGSSLGGALPG
jgi:hypothetical protein